jgi:hypothetical protein
MDPDPGGPKHLDPDPPTLVNCVFCTQILGKNTPVLVRMRMASFFNPEVTWVDQGNNLPSLYFLF